jgi:hypothetical protein
MGPGIQVVSVTIEVAKLLERIIARPDGANGRFLHSISPFDKYSLN